MLSSTPFGSLVLKNSPSADIVEDAASPTALPASFIDVFDRLKNHRPANSSAARRTTGHSHLFVIAASCAGTVPSALGTPAEPFQNPAGKNLCRLGASLFNWLPKSPALILFSLTYL